MPLKKGKYLQPAIDKIGQTKLFSPGSVTSLAEGKIYQDMLITQIPLTFSCHQSLAKSSRQYPVLAQKW